MMVAGRLIPVLAVGYIAYGLLPDSEDPARDTPLGHVAGNAKDTVDFYVSGAAQAYTGAKLGYALGTGLLGAVFS
jgi:hypothetical protein